MKSKMLINASILSDHNTGLGVYTEQIVSRVCPLLTEMDVEYDILCGSEAFLPAHLRFAWTPSRASGPVSRGMMNILLAFRGYDLIWSTTQHGAIIPCRQVITVHDITPMKYPKGRNHQAFYYKYILPKVIRSSLGVITVSDNSKKDILDVYGSDIASSDDVQIIRESSAPLSRIDERESFSICSQMGVIPKHYFCVTGIHYDYKNIELAIEAIALGVLSSDLKLVIVGSNDNEYGRRLKALVESYSLESTVIFAGFVNDREKTALIQNSIACVYPSRYEGFGLPVLEAMNLGVPVLCSSASSLPEVAGDAAIYFDPDDVIMLASAMSLVADNEGIAKRLVRLGELNLQRFDWNEIARQMAGYLYGMLKVQ